MDKYSQSQEKIRTAILMDIPNNLIQFNLVEFIQK